MFSRFEHYGSSRIFAVVALALLVMALFTAPAYSHGPAKVTLSYDLQKQILTVTVTHSPFGGDHYVKEIEIGKNGQSVAKYPYNTQTGEKFTYTYQISAKAGDTLEVKATCSKYGSKTGKIIVREPT
ncbi:MAG TPA: hypothetical protein PLR20_10635 [Syntrophales bacterium]|nr:hypothetical protein [Syntrophales bacterium]HOX94522.1 hypothetical protein [Syntrophales bacterium]HPI57507.1 hypothetical protein [Syntrophales bacterium]HPN24664.1 hypothetical protein [Syntrophales bacterium]HQM29795.1 hypothetical protein [Syntrophales bacterium]